MSNFNFEPVLESCNILLSSYFMTFNNYISKVFFYLNYKNILINRWFGEFFLALNYQVIFQKLLKYISGIRFRRHVVSYQLL